MQISQVVEIESLSGTRSATKTEHRDRIFIQVHMERVDA